MPLHVRLDGPIAILSNVGRMLNDPRHVDAAREVTGLLDDGVRAFVIELRDVGETGATLLGVLVSMTRLIRQRGGDVVLAGVSRSLGPFLDEMRMSDFWDTYPTVLEAKRHFGPVEPPEGPR